MTSAFYKYRIFQDNSRYLYSWKALTQEHQLANQSHNQKMCPQRQMRCKFPDSKQAQRCFSRAAFVWSCVFQGKGDAKNEPEEEFDQVHRFDDRDGNHRNRERSGRRYPPHGQAVKNGLGKEILLLTLPLSRNRLPDALCFFIPRVTKRRLRCING